MTGVLLAVPQADFVLHNSLFLVAHFHNVIIGGVLFGAFAGYTYWFPKAFGFKLHEGLGKSAFWCWFSFFTLVGCHGLHVTAGLLWLLTMMAQVFAKEFRDDVLRRMLCYSLWHALDIVWVAVFTVVYLMGAQG